jgi:hypothetical protein
MPVYPYVGHAELLPPMDPLWPSTPSMGTIPAATMAAAGTLTPTTAADNTTRDGTANARRTRRGSGFGG